jgi:uncharacterized protein YdhG (YjbR/CyaY superfamily)
MPAKPTTVAEYLEALPEDRRDAIDQLRALIRRIAPDVVEGMEYGMLAYSRGERLFCLASQKRYLALYVGAAVVEAHREALGRLDCGKGCIRFRNLDELPLEVVSDIVKDAIRRGKGECRPG